MKSIFMRPLKLWRETRGYWAEIKADNSWAGMLAGHIIALGLWVTFIAGLFTTFAGYRGSGAVFMCAITLLNLIAYPYIAAVFIRTVYELYRLAKHEE